MPRGRNGGDEAEGGAVPSRESLDALHARLLRHDPVDEVAAGELVVLALEEVTRRVDRRAGRLLAWAGATVRADAVHDAAVSACLSYVKRPQQYDPQRTSGGLLPYLVLAAQRDLLNARAAIKRQHQEAPLSLVELRRAHRNTELTPVGVGEPSNMDAADGGAEERALAPMLELMKDERERTVLRLMAAEERHTEAFAAALQLGYLPPEEQRRAVKQYKDRIKKRLERAGLAPGVRGTRGGSGG
jgi:hypothetical protein